MTKTIKRIIAGISAVAVIAGAAVGGWLINEYVIEDNQFTITDQIDGGDGGMQISEAEGNGISLMSMKIATADYEDYGISPMAESAQQLTATITPSNASNKTVDWSVAWVNSSSTWASGKTVTDYVTVTPTSDGALTANVECKQAFGEQIKVICTSRDNENAKAECNVDYAKKVNFVGVKLNTMRENYSAQLDSKKSLFYIAFDFSSNTSYGNFELTPYYSDYTIDDTFEISAVRSLAVELWNSKVGGVTTEAIPFNYTDNMQYDSVYFLQDYGSTEVTSALGQNLAMSYLEDLDGAAHENVAFTFTGEHSTYVMPVELRFNTGTFFVRTEVVSGLTNLIF